MRTILKVCVVALSAAAVIADNGKSRKSNCPQGLNCRDGKVYPHPQGQTYAGNPYENSAIGYALFSNPNPAILGGIGRVGLDFEAGVYSVIGQYAIEELTKLETPFFIRGNTYVLAATWNSQTYFNKEVEPVTYEPSVNFPFQASRVITAAFNTTRNQNIAASYAILRLSEYLTPNGVVAKAMLSQFGIDVTYRGVSNASDPRDIGNIAAAATIAYAKADGWNSESAENAVWKHPYSDYSEFIPANDAYELKNVAKWQPLMETKDDGNYVAQVHVAAQLQAEKGGYAVTKAQLLSKYRFKQQDLMFKNDGSEDDPLTTQELALLKREVDTILATSANLNSVSKTLAEFFDAKALSFAYMPINSISDMSYTFMKTLALDLGFHLAMLDSTLVAWNEKIRINQVRPVSAVRYLYGNTQVTAYGGPYQGTKTFSGSDWNSYLRTMPHSDFPSGTTCVCVAFAEFVENWRQTPGRVDLRWDFLPGSSMREPGVSPSAPITSIWGTTDHFINDCSYSRVTAGVHFNATVTASIDFCQGIGTQVWNKFQNAAKAIL